MIGTRGVKLVGGNIEVSVCANSYMGVISRKDIKDLASELVIKAVVDVVACLFVVDNRAVCVHYKADMVIILKLGENLSECSSC